MAQGAGEAVEGGEHDTAIIGAVTMVDQELRHGDERGRKRRRRHQGRTLIRPPIAAGVTQRRMVEDGV